MPMTLADRSNYYRGLLILIRKDNIITEEEKATLLRLGEILQFNRSFCEDTIRDLLNNPHFDESPPKFSSQAVAEMFLQDGIRVAFADHNLHKAEFKWMQEIADLNGVNAHWFSDQLYAFLDDSREPGPFKLEQAAPVSLPLSLPAVPS